MKYHNLGDMDTVQPGDQFFSKAWNAWQPCTISIGGPCHPQTRYRRPIKEQDEAARLIRATKRIRSRTTLGKLETLIALRTAWTRKQTVATAKVAALNRQITGLAKALAEEKFEGELNK